MSKFKTMKIIQKEKPFNAVLTEFSDAFVTGKFCDVKVVCKVIFMKLNGLINLQNFKHSGYEFMGS